MWRWDLGSRGCRSVEEHSGHKVSSVDKYNNDIRLGLMHLAVRQRFSHSTLLQYPPYNLCRHLTANFARVCRQRLGTCVDRSSYVSTKEAWRYWLKKIAVYARGSQVGCMPGVVNRVRAKVALFADRAAPLHGISWLHFWSFEKGRYFLGSTRHQLFHTNLQSPWRLLTTMPKQCGLSQAIHSTAQHRLHQSCLTQP